MNYGEEGSSLGSGVGVVREIVSTSHPESDGVGSEVKGQAKPAGSPTVEPAALQPSAASSTFERRDWPPLAMASADAPVIDVFVGWTDTENGNVNLTHLLARAGIDQMNAALGRSNADVTVRLVGVANFGAFTPHTGGTLIENLAADMESLQLFDGVVDVAHSYRAATGADLVLMLYSPPSCGGYAAKPNKVADQDAAKTAFATIGAQCAVLPDVGFPHEASHLLSADHVWDEGPLPGSYEYAHGWRDPVANFSTIHGGGVSQPRILNFSNRGVFFNGAATGTLGGGAIPWSENIHAIQVTRNGVANYRAASNVPRTFKLSESNPAVSVDRQFAASPATGQVLASVLARRPEDVQHHRANATGPSLHRPRHTDRRIRVFLSSAGEPGRYERAKSSPARRCR